MARRSRERYVPARQVLRRVRTDVQRGWPPGLTALTGDDLYHLDLAQRELLAALVPAGSTEYALTVFGEERVPLSTVVTACRSRGMFSTRRVVLVRDVAALEGEPEPLVEYAADPPADSFLVVRAPRLDQRRKLHKALAGAGRLLRFAIPAGADLAGQIADINQLAAEQGLRLRREAAALLAEACGGDLYRADAELEKMRAWRGEESGGPITADEVRQVAAGGGLLTGWEVADALLERDRPRAMAAARRIMDAGEEPIRILGGLAWRARTLLQAKTLLAAGRSRREVVQAARAWSYEDSLFRGLERYSLPELLAVPALLLKADRTLKSRSVDPRAVLERLVAEITAEDGS